MPAVTGCSLASSSVSAPAVARAADSEAAPRRVHPVEHQPGQRHPLLAEPLHEVGRLAQRVALRGGDHDEGRAAGLQQAVRRISPLAEAAEHGVERCDERLQVLEHLGAEHLGQDRRHGVEADADHLEVGPAARLGPAHQHADEAAVEEGAEPLGRVEEVQGRPAGRRVHDDQVPAVLGAQLPELLHRHVLLRAGEARRQGLVEGVVHDRLGPLGRGVGEDDLVEGPLHVEHHRVERAALGLVDPLDPARAVVQLGQAHRLRQPAGRVDGEDDDRAAGLGGSQAERRRGRRLADPAGAAAHDDPRRPVGDDLVEVEAGCWGRHRPLMPCPAGTAARPSRRARRGRRHREPSAGRRSGGRVP